MALSLHGFPLTNSQYAGAFAAQIKYLEKKDIKRPCLDEWASEVASL